MLWDCFITMMSWNQGNAIGVALLSSLFQLCKGEPILYEQMVVFLLENYEHPNPTKHGHHIMGFRFHI
jgi:hypothetical protein